MPLATMQRLKSSLVDADGTVEFSIDFDRDGLLVPYAELRVQVGLPLLCQRTLQRFVLPVQIQQRLGLIRDEAEEAALPEGYEPLLLPADGMLRTLDLVEDELILAVPVVPVMPGSEAVGQDWSPDPEEQERANPFAGLSALKDKLK